MTDYEFCMLPHAPGCDPSVSRCYCHLKDVVSTNQLVVWVRTVVQANKILWFVCGPTCGCGEVFHVVQGEEIICPRCGRRWGRAPIVGGEK